LQFESDCAYMKGRAGLKGRGARGNFHWWAPMTYFMTSSFVKFVFADSQRSRLLFLVVDLKYVPAEFTLLLAALWLQAARNGVKITVSCPYCRPHLNTDYQASEMHSRHTRTRAFHFNWQPRCQWCLHHYNCLLFIIIPPVTDVHVMLKKIVCERRVWSTKRSQRM